VVENRSSIPRSVLSKIVGIPNEDIGLPFILEVIFFVRRVGRITAQLVTDSPVEASKLEVILGVRL
jgi:hypothetical protein